MSKSVHTGTKTRLHPGAVLVEAALIIIISSCNKGALSQSWISWGGGGGEECPEWRLEMLITSDWIGLVDFIRVRTVDLIPRLVFRST